MAADPAPKTESPYTDELIAHAVRWWQAECDNAERLARRISILLTGLAVLAGLGIVRFEWYRRANAEPMLQYGWALVSVRLLISLAVLAFATAWWNLQLGKQDPERFLLESKGFRLPHEYLEQLQASHTNADDARREIFDATYAAAQNLHYRNFLKKNRIQRAQAPFLIGLVAVLLSMLLYTWTSYPLAWS